MNMNNAILAAVMLFSSAGLAQSNKLEDELVVAAGKSQGDAFLLGEAMPVKIVVEGLQDAKNGFTVRILPARLYEDYKAGRVTDLKLDEYPHSVQVRYQQTLQLDAGNWIVLVVNTENVVKSLTAHVKIVLDPR